MFVLLKSNHPYMKLSILSKFLLVMLLMTLSQKITFGQFSLSITRCETVADVIALIDTVFLEGVNPSQYSNITFTGDPKAVGYFNGGYLFGFNVPQGIVMGSGFVEDLDGTNSCSAFASGNTGGGGDPDLAAASGQTINDACIIEFDFMPTGDTARFNYVFGSEEYHEWVNTQWNDVFGFFLSGPGISGTYSNDAINIAIVPGTTSAVTIANVNCGRQQTNCTPPPGSGPNCQFLYDNTNTGNSSFSNTALDAYTSPFVAKNSTETCQWYHIKLAIGDAGDAAYDSGGFLEKGSFDPGSVEENTTYTHPTVDSLLYESCNNHEAILYFDVGTPRSADYIIPYQIFGTATLDEDYTIIGSGHEDTIYIDAGQLYDSLIIRPFWDNVTEGIEDVRIVYNPVICGFSTPDTVITLIADIPEFPDTNRVYNVYCEDTIPIGFADILEGVPPYAYEWYNSEWPVSISNTEYIDVSITGENSDYWYCLVTDTCGYESVDTAFVIVPELETDAGLDKSMCNQPSVDLEGISLGAQYYNWLSNPLDPTITGQGNDTISVSPTQTTEYILVATDNCTNSNQDTAYVTLDGAVANASEDGSICLNDSITLSCNIGNSNETYIWSSVPNDPGLSSQITNQTIKVSPSVYTIYSVEVTDDCEYKDTDDVVVTVYDLPVANAGNNNEICLGEEYVLNATGGISYQWGSLPMDPSLSINGQDTLANPTVEPSSETLYKYFVTVININGCSTTDTMELTVNQTPNIELIADNDAICFGQSVIVTASGDIADDYQWSALPPDPSLTGINHNTINTTPDTTTTYSLIATVGGINCPATPEYSITVIPQLYSSFDISSSETCENESTEVTYIGNASANATYNWEFGLNASINAGSGQGPYNISWPNAGIISISLNLEEEGCLSDTVLKVIEIISMPQAEFSADPESGCAELEVNFTNLSSNLDDATFSWNINGSVVTDSNASYVFKDSGIYPISLATTNRNICVDDQIKNDFIIVHEIPTSNFDADPHETILEDGIINFINTSSSQDNLSYMWYFGDNDSSSFENPEHKYLSQGIYLVELITTTINGCIDKSSMNVIIHPDFAVYPPNAFTPNGDGENDKFDIKGIGVSSYYLKIFSRWGELIFESENLEEQWDGTYNGELVSNGTYVYTINYKSMVDKDYSINGTVTVIR